MRVAIRADGSHDIGLGHLYRSAIVATELRDRGHDVTTLTRTPEHAARITPDRVDVVALSEADEIAHVTEWVNAHDVDAIVTDTYDIDTSYQRRLADTRAALTVVLDDFRYRIHADVLVNGNIYAPELTYEWEGVEPRWCLGTEFLLLREPFRTYASTSQPYPASVDEVIVTMGGVDKENRTPTVMRALDRFDVAVTVIVGPGFETSPEIRETATRLDGETTVLEDPDDLPERFLDADLAVSTLGTTTYELLATQTPIVGIPDNDTPIPGALEARDAALVLPRIPTEDDMAASVARVLETPDLRRALWRAGNELISGDGPENVADAIEGSVSRE